MLLLVGIRYLFTGNLSVFINDLKLNQMKLTLLSIIFLIFSFHLMAQNTIVPQWIKVETSSIGTAEGWGIDIDANNEVYWVVSTDELNQGLDVKCYKFNDSGEELWDFPFLYGGMGTQQAYVANVVEDALYIGGRICTGLINTCDMMLLKIDKENGTLIWDEAMNFNGNGYDEVDGLEILNDGIYCSGWAQEIQSGSFQTDMGFWKLDYDGNTEWVNHFGEANSAEHQDGHIVVDDDFIYAAGLWNGTGFANLYNGYSFLGKFSKTDGQFIDSTLFGHQSNIFLDIENALGMTSDGEFLYITGYTTPVTANDWQIFIAKYDKDLNEIWYTDWGGTGTETARGIVVQDDLLYVAGLTESIEIMSGEGRDGLLLKLDLDGNILKHYTWGNSQKNSFQDLQIHNNHIYLTGTTQIDSMGIMEEAFLLSFDPLITSIDKEEKPSENSFEFFPNPANGKIHVLVDDQDVKKPILRVLDLNGNVLQKTVVENGEIELEIKESGYFLININFGKYAVSKKVFNW